MAHGDDGRRLVSNSEIEAFRDCPRHWWLRYYRRLAPIRESAPGCAAVGTLIHRGLDLYYSGNLGYDPQRVIDALEEEGARDVELCGDDAARASMVEKAYSDAVPPVRNYMRWVEETGADARLTFETVESEYRMPIDGRYTLRGKLDLLASEEGGSLSVVDHKSVTSFQDSEWAHLRGQFRTYALLAEYETGRRVDTVEINLVKRAANPRGVPAYRAQAPINESVLDAHYRHLRSTLSDMGRAEDRLVGGEDHHDVVPPRATRDCLWKCPFLSVCPAFDRGEDAEFVLQVYYQTEDPDARYNDAQEES